MWTSGARRSPRWSSGSSGSATSCQVCCGPSSTRSRHGWASTSRQPVDQGRHADESGDALGVSSLIDWRVVRQSDLRIEVFIGVPTRYSATVMVRDLLYSVYERRLVRRLTGKPHPRHVGVIVDGNRRWAREMGYVDPNDGHRVGAERIKELLRWCDAARVEHVTLWLLSTDNLGRSAVELDPLLQIIENLAAELADEGNPWRLRMVGALDLLPTASAQALKGAEERTIDRTGGAQVNLAVGYGGRREIADAVR